MATLEELEARVAQLETTVSGIRSCTCDPSKYASSDEFDRVRLQVSALETAVAGIRSCTCDPTKYASQAEFDNAKRAIGALEAAAGNLTKLIGTLPEGTAATTIVGYVDEKTNVPTCQLPLTAAELTEKLNKV